MAVRMTDLRWAEAQALDFFYYSEQSDSDKVREIVRDTWDAAMKVRLGAAEEGD